MRVSLRLFRPNRQAVARRHPQGEEYEIEKAEQEAQKERDQLTASLFEKAGHAHYPYLKDPFE